MTEHPRLHAIPGGRDDQPQRPRADREPRAVPRPQVVPHSQPVPGPQGVPGPQTVREPLWREVLGERLRALRQEQRETLVETAGRAGVSPQYLSEVERGRKEPSSEMIAALAGALGTSLGGLTEQVARELLRQRHAALPRQFAPRSSTSPTLLAFAA
ncbi:helix-turn-helix domain-containing protein [Nocardia sp. NPDC052566]|uniref:helix-turn-helix domain-containing protein n=1 Tax=Nocardia sp. NPDC052566 TaxID=3364330 RepID=UPI0037C766C7